MKQNNEPLPPTLERYGVTEKILDRCEVIAQETNLLLIEQGLRQLSATNLIVHGIQHAILTQVPLKEIIQNIKDFHKENPEMITKALGENLMNVILNTK